MDTLEATEAALDTVIRVNVVKEFVSRSDVRVVAGVTVVGVSAAVISHIITKKKLSKKYSEIADNDIAEVKKHYAILRKEGPYSEPTTALKEYASELEQLRYMEEAVNNIPPLSNVTHVTITESTTVIEEPSETVRRKHIFDNNDPDHYFIYDEEVASRTPDKPYVLHHDEFMESQAGFDQISVTYYDEDDVLADERDQVMADVDATIGDTALLRFGHGSGEDNVVYIRNERLGVDYEITRSKGKYAEQVLGYIEHSDTPRFRRLRRDDE